LRKFEQDFNEKVRIDLQVTDYDPIAETRLKARADIDVLYGGWGMYKWYSKGWIGSIDDMEGINELKKDMYPFALDACQGKDGKMIGLPYYAATYAFMYNTDHLQRASIDEPPTTWEELWDQCETLKKKGISKYPFNPQFTREWGIIVQHLYAFVRSQGGELFDDNLNPIYDQEGTALECLKYWIEAQKQEFTPPGLLTMDYIAATNVFLSGLSTFFWQLDYFNFQANDPEQSKVAGNVTNALYPGKTHSSWTLCSPYVVTSYTPRRKRALKLLYFFCGRDKEGKYYAASRWLQNHGLGSGYKPVMEDPDNVNYLKTKGNFNIEALKTQYALSLLKKWNKEPWLTEFEDNLGVELQRALAGEKTPEQALSDSAEYTRKLKAQYE
jgi:multiple sugar transport system substrate-binding protein